MPPRPTTSPPDHPGTFIQEELDERGLTQADLAYILGMLPQQLNPIMTGKGNISPDMAAQLGEAFDVPAEFFANLQKDYDLHHAKPVDPGVRTRATWTAHFPIREMIKRGWIEATEPALLDLQMMRFFGKNRVEDVPFIGDGRVDAYAAKKSGDHGEMNAEQFTWLNRVKQVAKTEKAPLYSETALRGHLPMLRSHLMDKDDLIRIPEILRKCGVRFALVEALPGSKIDGVCVWIDGQPAIGMTTRLDRLDNFAFVLRHEIAHVLHGDGREASFTPVDEIGVDFDATDIPADELRANKEAAEFCVPRGKLDSFIARKGKFISERDVLAFAASLEIHPAIVIGQIQHKTNKYNWLRKYQTGIRSYLLDWQHTDGWGHQAPVSL